jgi:chromosome segregation ATPase
LELVTVRACLSDPRAYLIHEFQGRIWDYINDIYVHFTTDADAMIFRTDDNEHTAHTDSIVSPKEELEGALDEIDRQKIENCMIEYDQFLQEQLEAQRTFWEEEIAKERYVYAAWRELRFPLSASEGVHRQCVHRVSAIQRAIQRACGGDLSEAEMCMVEELKLEISGLEAEHARVLEEVRAIEARGRDLRRENNRMIQEQKQSKDRVQHINQRAKALRERFAHACLN